MKMSLNFSISLMLVLIVLLHVQMSSSAPSAVGSSSSQTEEELISTSVQILSENSGKYVNISSSEDDMNVTAKGQTNDQIDFLMIFSPTTDGSSTREIEFRSAQRGHYLAIDSNGHLTTLNHSNVNALQSNNNSDSETGSTPDSNHQYLPVTRFTLEVVDPNSDEYVVTLRARVGEHTTCYIAFDFTGQPVNMCHSHQQHGSDTTNNLAMMYRTYVTIIET